MEDEEDHGVSEHRITPLRCQPSEGYEPAPAISLTARTILHLALAFESTQVREASKNVSSPLPSSLRTSFVNEEDGRRRGDFLNRCARRLYPSLPSAVSRAPFYPPEHSPLEKVGRGGGYLGVLSVISLALLLPTLSLSLSLHPSLRPRAMSQATFAPGAGELGGLLGALLPPLLTPLTAHKVRTVRGRWFRGVVGLEWERTASVRISGRRGVQIGNTRVSLFIYLFIRA